MADGISDVALLAYSLNDLADMLPTAWDGRRSKTVFPNDPDWPADDPAAAGAISLAVQLPTDPAAKRRETSEDAECLLKELLSARVNDTQRTRLHQLLTRCIELLAQRGDTPVPEAHKLANELRSAAAGLKLETVLKPKGAKSGRRKADYDTVQREAQLVADWERARDAGAYKADFAKERGLTQAKLDALLTRVRMRNSRANN